MLDGMGVLDEAEEDKKDMLVKQTFEKYDEDNNKKLDFNEFAQAYNRFVTIRDQWEAAKAGVAPEFGHLSDEDKARAAQIPVMLEKSVFASRRKTAESGTYFDTDSVLQKAFKLDWKRIESSPTFYAFCEEAGLGEFKKEKKFTLNKQGKELKEVIHKWYPDINRLFAFFSTSALEGAMHGMDFGEFTEFAGAAGFHQGTFDPVNPVFGAMDLKTCFEEVNVEVEDDGAEATGKRAKKKAAENAANENDVMLRFEFVHCIMRMVSRFPRGEGVFTIGKQAADFMQYLDVNVEDKLPRTLIDRNMFRLNRLYNPDVLDNLFQYNKQIRTLYSICVGPDFNPITLQEWMWFMYRLDIFDERKGRRITQRETHLMFTWSQMMVSDEIKGRESANTLTFDEFLEALCRLADCKDLPDEESLRQHEFENSVFAIDDAIERDRAGEEPRIARRPSSDFWAVGDKHTRTLSDRVVAMLDYAFAMIAPNCGSVLLGTFDWNKFVDAAEAEYMELYKKELPTH